MIGRSEETWVESCLKLFDQQAFYNVYHKTFEVVAAETDDLRDKIFRLRYRVYCLENCFISPDECHGAVERDEYDDEARHFALIHPESGEVVGALRILLPDLLGRGKGFELQKFCDHPFLHKEQVLSGVCEISRFCVAPEFRRRPRDGFLLPAYYEQESAPQKNGLINRLFRRRIPYAPLGLLAAAFECALGHGITNCVTAVESGQLEALQKLNFSYRALGPRIDQRVAMQPLVFDIKSVLDGMEEKNPACWEVLSDKGRLHARANQIHRHSWLDTVFDEECVDMILDKLT